MRRFTVQHFHFILHLLVLLSAMPAQAEENNVNSPSIHHIPDPASGRSALSLILMPANIALREELDIATSQLDELRKIEETCQQRSNAIMRSWMGHGGQPNAQHTEMIMELRNVQRQVFEELGDILREEQFTRLRQIEFQRTTQFDSLVPLSWNVVMTELGLSSDEQTVFVQEVKTRSEALKKMSIESQQSVPDVIARLVTHEQRQKLKDLYGEPLDNVAFYDHTVPPNGAYRGQGMSAILLAAKSPIIAKDLELLDEQAEKINALFVENSRAERKVLQKQSLKQREATRLGKGNLGPPVEEFKILREAIDKRVAEILLPHQMKRLRQLDFQIRVTREAVIPLLSTTAANAIGLTQEKRAELSESYAREYQLFLQERDRAFYESLDNLLETLSPEQQKRYHLLVGKRFDKWFQ